MARRTTMAFVRGVGSLVDLGGTSYKRTPIRIVKKGDFAADRRAMARDGRTAVRHVLTSERKKSLG